MTNEEISEIHEEVRALKKRVATALEAERGGLESYALYGALDGLASAEIKLRDLAEEG